MSRIIRVLSLVAAAGAVLFSAGRTGAGVNISSGVLHAFAQVINDDGTGTDAPADKTFSAAFSATQSASASATGLFSTSANVTEMVSAGSNGITINSSGFIGAKGQNGQNPQETVFANTTIGLTITGSQAFSMHSEGFGHFVVSFSIKDSGNSTIQSGSYDNQSENRNFLLAPGNYTLSWGTSGFHTTVVGGNGVSNFTLTPVPEPALLAVIPAALLALARRRRRFP